MITGRIVGETYFAHPNRLPDIVLWVRSEKGKERYIIPSNVRPHFFVRTAEAAEASRVIKGLGKYDFTPQDLSEATLAEKQDEPICLIETNVPEQVAKARRALESAYECKGCGRFDWKNTCPNNPKHELKFHKADKKLPEGWICKDCGELKEAAGEGPVLFPVEAVVRLCYSCKKPVTDKAVTEAFEADRPYTGIWKKHNGIKNKVKLIEENGTWRAEPYEGEVPPLHKGYYDLEIDDSQGKPTPQVSRIICSSIVSEWLKEPAVSCSDHEGDIHTEINYYLKTIIDLLIGWNSEKFDDEFLEERIPNFDRHMCQKCDLLKLLAFKAERRMESLKLPDVVTEILVKERKTYAKTVDRLPSYMKAFQENRPELRRVNLSHALALKDIDEALDSVNMRIEMADLVGVQVRDTYFYSRVIDAIVLKKFYDMKPRLVARCRREDPGAETYTGATIFKPTPGQHDIVLHYDLVSLYNRIVQALNISPELWSEVGKDPELNRLANRYFEELKTRGKDAPETAQAQRLALEYLISLLAKLPEGLFPREMRKIEAWRKELKAEKKKYEKNKDSPEFKKANSLDRAVKTLLLAFYGQLGEARSRFYIPLMAALVTYAGREFVTETANQLIKLGAVILYGDTDSVFAKFSTQNLTAEQAEELGRNIQKFLNSYYPKWVTERWNLPPERAKLFEVGFEEVYDTIFFGEVKKKYAGWAHGATKPEIVGYEKIRSDWCKLAREMQDTVINMRLKKVSPTEIKSHILKVKNDLLDGTADMNKLVISKGMSKKAEEYKVLPPHVRASIKAGGMDMKVRFVISKATKTKILEVEPLQDNQPIPVPDLNTRCYYWAHQVFPPTERVLWGMFAENELEQLRQTKASPLEAFL